MFLHGDRSHVHVPCSRANICCKRRILVFVQKCLIVETVVDVSVRKLFSGAFVLTVLTSLMLRWLIFGSNPDFALPPVMEHILRRRISLGKGKGSSNILISFMFQLVPKYSNIE